MVTHRHHRAAVDPVTLIVIVALGLGGAKLAGWKPSELFRKPPPTKQVSQLEQDLAAKQAALDAANAKLQAAAEAERRAQEEQIRNAQQMAAGAAAALARQPVEHRTAQTQLASDLLNRSEFALGKAIGSLPADKQAEILAIVDKALSGVQAERDEAKRLLAAKDAALQAVTIEREQIKAQLPVLSAQVEAKDAAARAVQAELKVATGKVLLFADQADKERRESSSLTAALERWLAAAAVMVGLYLAAAYVVPLVLKLMRPGRTKTILRHVAGFAAGGLHYLDAHKKLTKAAAPPIATP